MRRLFYLSVGIAAGVYATQRFHRAVHAWTPTGLAEGAAGVSATAREIAQEVRATAAQREAELRGAAGLDEMLETHEQVRKPH